MLMTGQEQRGTVSTRKTIERMTQTKVDKANEENGKGSAIEKVNGMASTHSR